MLPEDYEPCGQCGYDHGYEYESAVIWHTANEAPVNLGHTDSRAVTGPQTRFQTFRGGEPPR